MLSNRVCFPTATCTPGTYEQAAPSPTSDRVCRPCNGTFEFTGADNEPRCRRMVAGCNSTQRLAKPGSATGDIVCEACPPGHHAGHGEPGELHRSNASCVATTTTTTTVAEITAAGARAPPTGERKDTGGDNATVGGATTTPAPEVDAAAEGSSGGLGGGAVAGITIGILVLVAAGVVVILFSRARADKVVSTGKGPDNGLAGEAFQPFEVTAFDIEQEHGKPRVVDNPMYGNEGVDPEPQPPSPAPAATKTAPATAASDDGYLDVAVEAEPANPAVADEKFEGFGDEGGTNALLAASGSSLARSALPTPRSSAAPSAPPLRPEPRSS